MSEPETFRWEYEKEADRLRARIAELEAELAGIMSSSTGVMLQESQEREERQVARVIELQERIAELEGANTRMWADYVAKRERVAALESGRDRLKATLEFADMALDTAEHHIDKDQEVLAICEIMDARKKVRAALAAQPEEGVPSAATRTPELP